jgi:streptogramin lyase
MLKQITLAASLTIAALPVTTVTAATINGQITTEAGQPIAGALVTLWNEQRNQKETVYTDASGNYHLTTEMTGAVTLRGRSPYFRDINQPLSLNQNTVLEQNLSIAAMTDPNEISATLTASAHASTLPFEDDGVRNTFISQCNYCHQQGNSITRAPRDEKAWSDTVWRMETYASYLTYGEHKQVVNMLHEGFNGEAIEVLQTYEHSPELSQAKVKEWLVATPMSFLHDTVVGSDGKLYGIDEGSDTIYALDRTDGSLQEFKMDPEDEPVGGDFVGIQMPLGIFTGSHGPHSMVEVDDGRMFITAALSSSLFELDPKTGQFTRYHIPRGFLWRKGMYPHTIRKDKDNNVWFTVTFSNRVMKFDTSTHEFTDIGLPSDGALNWMSDMFMGTVLKVAGLFPNENTHMALSHHKWLNGGKEVLSMPYGIDVNPNDGSIWYGKLIGNKIGRINPETLEIVEYDTPHRGPRRMRFDKDGILWIPSFDEGVLMRFDPKTEEFENIPLPLLSEGEYEVPYALNVHEHTGDIWIAANNSDRMLRYIPGEKRFISYPMPSRVVWFRDFEFTEDGQVCTSNSNLPAYAHEDGLPAFVCLDPEYQPSTSNALESETVAKH